MVSKVSFIIPHRGREEMLRQTLDSIAAQKYDKRDIEVIVVTQNQSMTNDTVITLRNMAGKLIRAEESDTISQMRNQGVEQSSGEYLAFLDADIHIESNWIVSMLSAMQEQPSRVIVSAVQSCPGQAPVLEKIRTELSNVCVDCNVEFLPGRNLFLRRSSFEKSGGFPAHLVTCEDYYFTQKVAEQGQLYYTSRSNYIHLGEDKQFDLMFKKEIWRGQSNLHSLKGRKVPLSEIPSFLVPVWFALFATTFVVSFPFLSRFTSTLLLLLALFPVGLYSWRLHQHSEGRLPLPAIVRFYSLYFPARFWGTLIGLFKIVKT
ncbi:MAG: glycosyltransferase family 2 protein [Cellvibrionaceae bacterium]|nr:glycosyltransferase family 2 protein [Cellvibrionaceae bacterium]